MKRATLILKKSEIHELLKLPAEASVSAARWDDYRNCLAVSIEGLGWEACDGEEARRFTLAELRDWHL